MDIIKLLVIETKDYSDEQITKTPEAFMCACLGPMSKVQAFLKVCNCRIRYLISENANNILEYRKNNPGYKDRSQIRKMLNNIVD